MPRVAFYPQSSINRNLIDWLVTHEMWDEESKLNGGLKDLYDHVCSAMGTHRAICAWVLIDGMEPIGIAAIEKREVHGLHLFVKPTFRRMGYGEELLNAAFTASLPFGVFYTEAAKTMYQKYNLQDVSDLL